MHSFLLGAIYFIFNSTIVYGIWYMILIESRAITFDSLFLIDIVLNIYVIFFAVGWQIMNLNIMLNILVYKFFSVFWFPILFGII